MDCQSRRLLVIVCRNPDVGNVKTRLIPALGADGVRALYRAFLQDLSGRFADREYDLLWAYTPEGGPLAVELTSGRIYPQEGPDLGRRLLRIFERSVDKGYDRVVVISSDVPHLPVEVVEAAFEGLCRCDVVLAPSEDGGYHLVGMRGVYDIFTMVPMSTPAVFEQTREIISERGLCLQILTADFDVDVPEDLPRLTDRLAQDAALSQGHTARALDGMQVLTR